MFQASDGGARGGEGGGEGEGGKGKQRDRTRANSTESNLPYKFGCGTSVECGTSLTPRRVALDTWNCLVPRLIHDRLATSCIVNHFIMFQRPATALLVLLALCLTVVIAAGPQDKLQIGVKYKPDDCPLKTRNGDKLSMQ